MSDDTARKAVGEYLAIKQKIAVHETEAEEKRREIVERLQPDGAPPGTFWSFDGIGRVDVVKGRVSEKLDRARLARAGVAADVLDAATVRTEGKATMRISAAKEVEGGA